MTTPPASASSHRCRSAGQAAGGGSTNPFEALSGLSSGYGSSGSSDLTTQAIQMLASQLLSGSFSDFKSLGIDGLDDSNPEFLSQDSLDPAQVSDYIAANRITADDLKWQTTKDGKQAIILSDELWDTVETADKTMLYDDGEGYIELGLDNIYDFDGDGNLLPNTDHDWISIEGQPVAYYHTETVDFEDGMYSISGYVPVEYNGRDAHLILTFDSDHEDGCIAGVQYDYDESVTQTEAKNLASLETGDQVKFLCDYYTYEGKYLDKYQLGRTWTVKDPDNVSITNTDVGEGDVMIMYKFIDIYGQEHWTPTL